MTVPLEICHGQWFAQRTAAAAEPRSSIADATGEAGFEGGAFGTLRDADVRRRGPVRRFLAAHPWITDVTLAVLVLLVGAVTAIAARSTVRGSTALGLFVPQSSPLQLITMTWLVGAVVGAALLLARRSHALVVTVALTGAGVASLGTAGVLGVLGFSLACALYSVAVQEPTRTAWIAGMASFVMLLVALWWWQDIGLAEILLWIEPAVPEGDYVPEVTLTAPPFSAGRRLASVLLLLALLVVGLAMGSAARARRLHADGILERYRAMVRERDSSAALARAAERTRIAREMHDVVAHSVSVMVALADGAEAAIGRAPDRSREALRELAATGRSALSDMQGVLNALDPRVDSGVDPIAPEGPVDADLSVIVQRFQAAGMSVSMRGLDLIPHLETPARLAVVRIVTEALTNVLRHAPGAAVEVLARRHDDALEVEIADDGGRAPSLGGGTGRGVLGMRERAGLLGGRVEAGPRPEGGWGVRLFLPVPPDETGMFR